MPTLQLPSIQHHPSLVQMQLGIQQQLMALRAAAASAHASNVTTNQHTYNSTKHEAQPQRTGRPCSMFQLQSRATTGQLLLDGRWPNNLLKPSMCGCPTAA